MGGERGRGGCWVCDRCLGAGVGGWSRWKEGSPVESSCEDEVVVDGESVEAIVEVALVDEAPGFVDDDEGVDDPGRS